MSNEYDKNDKDEFSDLEEIFAEFFYSAKRNRREELNKNVVVICNITKQQAKEGIQKKENVSVAYICDKCKGTGKKTEYAETECKICYGTGFVYNKKEVTVNIPPKVKNNDYLIFKGKGNRFCADNERGDICIKIHIYGNKSKRKGRMIYE